MMRWTRLMTMTMAMTMAVMAMMAPLSGCGWLGKNQAVIEQGLGLGVTFGCAALKPAQAAEARAVIEQIRRMNDAELERALTAPSGLLKGAALFGVAVAVAETWAETQGGAAGEHTRNVILAIRNAMDRCEMGLIVR